MAKHKCLSCHEPFESPEFFNYLMRLRSKTVICLRCQDDNYVVAKKGGTYFLLLIISILIGLIIFAIPNIAFGIGTYNEVSGSFRVSWIAVVGGAILGVGAIRLIMNLFNWMFGEVSQDRKYKSSADYE